MADVLMAGSDFPWEWIQGYFLLFHRLNEFADVNGDHVGSAVLGAYGMVTAELSNPDVEERTVRLPIQNKDDYKSIYRAQLDAGVKEGTNQLILLFEQRKGLLGGRKPSFHIAAYPAGVWNSFFDAVASYKAAEFRWPIPLFVFQPGGTQVFPQTKNTIRN